MPLFRALLWGEAGLDWELSFGEVAVFEFVVV